MRKTINLLLAILMVLITVPAMAQAPQALPADTAVRIGKLPNGLTYYIRHNEKPKGLADFFIAQSVGSMLEEDNQRGLAHFLEHMCFNGTTHFPGKGIINWLETQGVKFGQNLNAYTSTEETVYNISDVPVQRKGVQDSCLLILHDWANDLLLLPEEIDAERGVIHEEWRRSMAGQMRILEQALPKMYPNSRYGYRLPIGTTEVIDNFEYQALRDYYEKWYRPDHQAIIVVGDIDVDYIEGKIKELFSGIEMPENPAERVYLPVEDNKGTLYAIGHDKEQTNNIVQLMFKTDVLPKELRNTPYYYIQDFTIDMIRHMLNARLSELSSKPDAPFAAAGLSYGEFLLAKTKEATTIAAVARSSADLPNALAGAYREVLRAQRGGFTVSEFERARNEYLSQWEKRYNNRDARENVQFSRKYVSNFIDQVPIPDIETEYQLVKMLASQFNVAVINQRFAQLITPDNRVLVAMMPDNAEGVYPTEEDFKTALEKVDAEDIEAFKDEVKAEPLIENILPAGKIVEEKHNAQWDATEMTLSNGVKVFVKHTDFKQDEIRMRAYAPNGLSTVKASSSNILFFPLAAQQNGFGTYSNSDIQKYMAGKQAAVSLSLSTYTRDIMGSTTPKDLEAMMELLYSTFTQFNFTADEFKAMQNTFASVLANQESNPQFIFQGKIFETIYNNDRLRNLTAKDINLATREGVIDIAKKMTDNAADFTFFFVGNTDLETLRPLIEKYIASLPADAAKAAANKALKFDEAYNPVKGTKVSTYTTKMETPQTWTYISQYGSFDFNSKDHKLASITGQILSKRLLDIVREKEGATYSIGAQCSMTASEPVNVELLTAFPMKPEMKDKILDICREQFELMAKEVSEEELAKITEFLAKNYKDNLERNEYWTSAMRTWVGSGVDTSHDYMEVLNSITTDDVKNFAKRLIDQGNYQVIVLDPEM